MDKVEKIQSKQYQFPYHYLPQVTHDSFRQGRWWAFSLTYVMALKLVEKRLIKRRPIQHLDIG